MFGFCDYIIYDGALGTMLQKRGLGPGQRPDLMNVSAPGVVESVHRMYVEAGSDIICTNTFGANATALAGTGYTPEEIITAAVSIAKRASGGRAKIALDIGPIGALLEPIGELEYEKAYDLFAGQAKAGEKSGADLAAIETMSDITEMKAAILAVTENTSLPVFATMTFDKTGRTYLGCTPEDFAEMAEQLGAAAVGINCSLEPETMLPTAERIAKATSLPLIIKPNAGLPDSATGYYSIGPAEFARQMSLFDYLGEKSPGKNTAADDSPTRRLMIVGGCCGTTPDHIRELKKRYLT